MSLIDENPGHDDALPRSTGRIDKLDLKIPAGELSSIIDSDLRHFASRRDFRGKYTAEIDCTCAGISARIYYKSIYAKDGHHKAELLHVGQRRWSQIVEDVSKLTTAAPDQIGVMRLDLAADDRHRSVEWYRRSVRRPNTRYFHEIRSTFDRKTGMTLQFGRRPDCLRIYDKTAELHYRYKKEQRLSGLLLSFEKWSGHNPEGVLTRVERQYARTLPPVVRTLSNIPDVIHLRPFSALVFRPGAYSPLSPDQFTLHEWIAGTWLRHNIEENGYEATRAFVNRWGRNFRRMERRCAVFLTNNEPPDLDELFVSGVKEQLSA